MIPAKEITYKFNPLQRKEVSLIRDLKEVNCHKNFIILNSLDYFVATKNLFNKKQKALIGIVSKRMNHIINQKLKNGHII